VLAMIGREGLTVCAVGLGLGVPLAVASTQMMRPLLYEISPMDPLRLTAALLVVAATAMLACIIPAYRAATVMPLAALRR
jgi:ABC-type antimicrobial peptide transport system permease subunit